jgi:hypothetical protein
MGTPRQESPREGSRQALFEGLRTRFGTVLRAAYPTTNTEVRLITGFRPVAGAGFEPATSGL